MTSKPGEAPAMRFLTDCGEFFRAFRRNFRSTGSILPSSRFLARALVRQLRGPRASGRILEVGPGTGPVTREIARLMQPTDHLDAVDINPAFVRLLERRVQEDPAFRARRHQVRVIESAVEDLPGEGVYDFIVSGLPLNNFPASQVRAVFRTFSRLLKPGGTLTYYEYVLVRQLSTPFVGPRERRRLLCVGRVVGKYIRDYQVRRERILINVPPATVRHLRFKPVPATVAPAPPVPIPELTS